MLTAKDLDIQYAETPLGFRLEASLTSYWAIPLVILAALMTYLMVFLESDLEIVVKPNITGALKVVGFIYILVSSLSLWYFAAERIFGVAILTFEQRVLTVETKVGPITRRRRLMVGSKDLISEYELSTGRGKYRAIQVEAESGSRVRFGWSFSNAQRKYLISLLRVWKNRAA